MLIGTPSQHNSGTVGATKPSKHDPQGVGRCMHHMVLEAFCVASKWVSLWFRCSSWILRAVHKPVCALIWRVLSYRSAGRNCIV